MESSAALEIWSRSVEKHSLAYTTYVVDDDSKSFKRLCDDDPHNGKEIVRKEECLGHTQKRLKKHLTKAPTKTLTSKRISAIKVQRIGHLYVLVVIQNRDKTATQLQQALYTLRDHLVEHETCPFSITPCYYQGLALSAESNPPPVLRQEIHLGARCFSSFATLRCVLLLLHFPITPAAFTAYPLSIFLLLPQTRNTLHKLCQSQTQELL